GRPQPGHRAFHGLRPRNRPCAARSDRPRRPAQLRAPARGPGRFPVPLRPPRRSEAGIRRGGRPHPQRARESFPPQACGVLQPLNAGRGTPTRRRRDPARSFARSARRAYIAASPHHRRSMIASAPPGRSAGKPCPPGRGARRPPKCLKEPTMSTGPLMPKATAVWLVENTALTFDQIADFCKLHPLEVKGIADGEVAAGIKGLDPTVSGQLTREEIARAEANPAYRLKLAPPKLKLPEVKRKKGPLYTPVSRRQDRPND